jgi:energy-coupling factor transporter ATP-binding protein EcfA2
VYKLAKTFKERGKTVIVVEPKLDRVLEHADRMLVLERGRLVTSGSPREALAQGTFERLHLELPSYASLANELRRRGWTQAQAPVRLDEARQMVLEALDGNP